MEHEKEENMWRNDIFVVKEKKNGERSEENIWKIFWRGKTEKEEYIWRRKFVFFRWRRKRRMKRRKISGEVKYLVHGGEEEQRRRRRNYLEKKN